MAYENFYPGNVYNLQPNSDSLYTGHTVATGSIGASAGAMSANQLQDVSNYLNQGMKVIETGTIKPEDFDMVPDQHLDEIRRLTKLNNAEATFHAPIVEPSGFTEQGGWSEDQREAVERQLKDVVLRASKMSHTGSMPATMHSTQILPGEERMPVHLFPNLNAEEKAKYAKEGGVLVKSAAVDTETGKLVPLKREEMYSMGGGGKPETWTPEEQLRSLNSTEWTNKLTNIQLTQKEAEEAMASAQQGNVDRAQLFIQNVNTSLRGAYEKVMKHGSSQDKKQLQEIDRIWKNKSMEMQNASRKNELDPATAMAIDAAAAKQALNILSTRVNAPQAYEKIEKFAVDNSAKTFSNVAYEAYKKLGDKAPIVSIENPPYGQAMSSGQTLKNLIVKSRKNFENKAVKEGMSRDAAKKAAAKMIGATWDTSHISMMRKQGFKPEQLTQEAKTIAPYVKHVHLNDNFGYSHTDLPPGMGDVPIADIMKKIEKHNPGVKKIFEGGNFFQHFKTSPHMMVLEAMGSPLYSSAPQGGPEWTNIYGTNATYSGGYGTMLPQQHFSTYGGGFSGMPTELGGQHPGAGGQSRMSGNTI